jgi:hypothetical protein
LTDAFPSPSLHPFFFFRSSFFEAALTGRVGLASPTNTIAPEEYTSDHHRDPSVPLMTQRANSVMSMDAVSEAEMEHMRLAVRLHPSRTLPFFALD